MNDYSPSESSPPKKHVLRTVLLIVGALILVLILRSCLIANFGEFSDYDIQEHPDKYPAFDFAKVKMRPEWYKDTTGMISGTFVGLISLPPSVDSPYTYMQIAQDGLVENKNAVWVVYGVLSDDDKQKLTEGMDVVVYGHCTGLVTVQRLAFDEELPGLFFENIKYGAWIRP